MRHTTYSSHLFHQGVAGLLRKGVHLVFFVPLLLLSTIGMSQPSFINNNGIVQYYMTDNQLGIVVVAQQYFNISRQGSLFMVTRGSVAGLPPDIRMVEVQAKVTLNDFRQALQNGFSDPNLTINPVGSIETLGPEKIGRYFTGVSGGAPVDGYMIGMMGPYQTGALVVNLCAKASPDVYNSPPLFQNHLAIVKAGATDQASMTAFYQPGTTYKGNNNPQPTPGQLCACCAGTRGSACTACGGQGQKAVQETRYQGTRTIYETVYKTCMTCSGTGKIKCACCFGTGRK